MFGNLGYSDRIVLRCLFTKRHSMKTYHGERTAQGCEVTVDGAPLRMCSNLSGNATTAFDWGYVGTGQLSLALLSNLLGNDITAMSMSGVFEREVVAYMPHERWTMTDHDFNDALAPLVGLNGARAGGEGADVTPSAAFGDMPVESGDLLPATLKAEDASANASMVSEGGHVDAPASLRIADATDAADEAVAVANHASDTAAAARAANEATRACDTPADEAMTTANRAADHEAYSTGRAAGKAVTVAREAIAEVKRLGKT